MKSITYLQDKRALETWYLKEHLTLEEIGEKLQISRQGVLYRMRKHCVDMRRGEKFEIACSGCGVKFEITRARWKKSEKHYHSKECFHKHNVKPAPAPEVPGDGAFEDLGYKR